MLKKVLFISLAITSMHAGLEQIKLKITGIDSEETSAMAEKLSAIEGIKHVALNKKGKVSLKLEENNNIDIEKLYSTIEKDTSFKLKAIKVVATGRIERIKKFYSLEMEENNPNKIILSQTPKFKRQADLEKSGFIVGTKTVYNKTMNFFKGFINKDDKFTHYVRMHCKHNASVKVSGFLKVQSDGSYELIKAKAKISEVDDQSDLLEILSKTT